MPENSGQILRAALYARVSTEEQREGQTIDSQVAELDRFARSKGWEIVGSYKDDGWSGSILARPDLDRLRDDASRGLFDIALFNDVDRLARDVSHLGIVKRDLERHSVQVVFKKLPTEKSPTNNLMVNILGSFAEFERELIADRTRRGRRHKVEARQLYLGCTASYGYRYIPKDAVANNEGYLQLVPEEAAVVKQMFSWVDHEGLSAREVVNRLTKMRIPTRKGDPAWAKSSVLKILRNEMYVGVWYYNKHESCEPSRIGKRQKYRRSLKSSTRLRSREEWLPVELPDELRIVERNQWERVQTQLTKNTSFSPRNTKHEYLLKGLVKCGACRASYVGDPNHGRFYYRCAQRCKKYRTIRDNDLDNTVWDAVEGAILNPSVIADQFETIQARKANAADALRSEGGEIETAKQKLQEEEDRILEAYRSSFLSPSLLGRELEKINAKRAILKTRESRLTEQTATFELPNIRQSLVSYCEAAAQRIQSFAFEERQRFLRLVVNEVVFEGDKATIRGVIPLHSLEEDSPSASKSEAGISKDVFATTEVYLSDRNTVPHMSFELVGALPHPPQSLQERIDAAVLRALLKQRSGVTLRELCDYIQKNQGLTLSVTSMSRVLRRIGLSLKQRRQLAQKTADEAHQLAA